MVHRDGQGHRGPWKGQIRRYAARPRPACDLRHPMGAARRPEPHHRHDRRPSRLGDLAPARLGVPIAVFVREKADGSAEILQDAAVNTRIADAFEREGADAWYMDGARERFLGPLANEDWKKIDDICDVWFNSGLDPCLRAGGPRALPGVGRHQAQGRWRRWRVMYLEGSDQHRGWFHSSLLASCGPAGGRRITSSSRTASRSTRTAARCRSRSATPSSRRR